MTINESKDTRLFNGRIQETPLKKALRSFINRVGNLPIIRTAVHAHVVRDTLRSRPGFKFLYRGVGHETLHPFDRAHGTETSGLVCATELPGSEHSSSDDHFHYWGSQPSSIRAAITTLPSPESFTFIDLGCGKGRSLLVASKYPFRDIVGVELSPSLAEIARKNAAIVAKKFPGRTPVQVEVKDACVYRFPPGNLFLYLYNPFGAEILSKVIAELEAALAAEDRDIFVAYFYPYFAECFEASPAFKRYHEATVPFAPEERGYGDPSDGTFIIWRGHRPNPPLSGADE